MMMQLERPLTVGMNGHTWRFMNIALTDARTWDKPLFPIALAARVAGVEGGTLRAWVQRGEFKLWDDDQPAARNGMARSLTFRTLLHISAAARLWSKGVKIGDAYTAVLPWLHAWSSAREAEELQNGLFPDPDWTLLIHFTGERSKVARASTSGGTLNLALEDLMAFGSPGPTIIFLNPIVRSATDICEEFLRSIGFGG